MRDWSSDVCSSDLPGMSGTQQAAAGHVEMLGAVPVPRDPKEMAGQALTPGDQAQIAGKVGEPGEAARLGMKLAAAEAPARRLAAGMLAGDAVRSEENTSELQSIQRIS